MAQAFLIGGNGTALPTGGVTGQALIKKSDSDYDVEWDESVPDYTTDEEGKVLTVKVEDDTPMLAWDTGLPSTEGAELGQALVLRQKPEAEEGILEPSWAPATPLIGADDVGKILKVVEDSETQEKSAQWVDPSSDTTLTAYNASHIDTVVAEDAENYYVTGVNVVGEASTLYAANNTNGSTNPNGVYFVGDTGVLMGAAWNDYAEFREGERVEPGMCVIEAGDDTLKLSDKYAFGASYIVSDTYGMAIGQTNKARIPVAVSGRVLAYPEEGRDLYRSHIGSPVCSGPHGKIMLMDTDFAVVPSWAAIGVVSSVPDYQRWNGVEVDGRVWIKVK